jgi:secondary thiamine-phosphate synthase enzyme
MVKSYRIELKAKPRGYHLIDSEIMANIPKLPDHGLLTLFIQHTSAAICINENADPTVREDFELIFNRLVPENIPGLKHTLEGPDDMPAHIKAALIGSSIQIPVVEGRLALGTWQGIYLCEFRNNGGSRHLIVNVIS